MFKHRPIGKTTRFILASLSELGPSTEKRLLAPIRPRGTTERWGHSWLTSGKGAGWKTSLVHRGLVEVIGLIPTAKGRKPRTRVFAITAAGREVLAHAKVRS